MAGVTSIISNVIPITDSEFRHICDIVYENFGISLGESKKSLVIGRLQKVLRARKFKKFQEYIDYLHEHPEALTELANRVSTNHTFFYREYDHFEIFEKELLPEIKDLRIKQGKRKIKLWCAAASKGDEPYTIMIHLMRFLGRDYSLWETGLLATDISEDALREAIKGAYLPERVEKVDKITLGEYFDYENGMYVVKDVLRNEIMFKKFNLMTPKFPFSGDFDAIFCRNVMIYFDEQTKEDLAKKMFDQLRPGGYLFVGHSETLACTHAPFKHVKSAIYQKA